MRTAGAFSFIPRAGRAALQWRLLVLWAALLAVPTIAAALPVWQLLGANLDHSVHVASLAQELDLVALADLAGSQQRSGPAVPDGLLTALLLTLLLSPLLTGMAAAAARAPQPLRFGGLLAGGVQDYLRMARMLVWAVVPLGIAAALGSAAMAAAGKYAERALLESHAELAGIGALLICGLLVLIAHASLDAGRAVLAADRRRRSAVRAWWDGCRLLLQRPGAALGGYLAISVVGLAVAAALGLARVHVPHAGVPGSIGALALTQLVVLALAWMRSARLFAMIALAMPARA